MCGEYSSRIIADYRQMSTPNVSDVLDKLGINGVIRGIFPVFQGAKIVGPAFCVKEVARKAEISEFRVTEALDQAKLGDVLVFDVGTVTCFSTWGGLASLSAKIRGIEGVVVDGAVRDVAEIRKLRFPVFTRSIVPVTGKGRVATVSINRKLEIEGVRIYPQDLVIGDDDGIAIVPAKSAKDVIKIAKKILFRERKVEKAIRKGRLIAEVEKDMKTRI